MRLGAKSTHLKRDVAASNIFAITQGAALRKFRFPLEDLELDEEERLEPPENDLPFFFFLSDRDGERPLSLPRVAGAAGDPCRNGH